MTERKFQVGDVVEILWVPGFKEEGQDFVKQNMPECLPFATLKKDVDETGRCFYAQEDPSGFNLWAGGLRLISAEEVGRKLHSLSTMSVGSLEAEAYYLQQRLAEVHKEIFSRIIVEE
jgi:hypothetical protein